MPAHSVSCTDFALVRYPNGQMLITSLLLLLQFNEPLASKDIPRFQMIAPMLYRGGQPERDGFAFLKQNGIKTVINLRTDNDEEAVVRDLGMNYIHIPISIKVWSKVPDAAVEQYFKVLSDPSNYPIFF